ncbi:SDR family oxidoreductase [Alloacidobacterium dinghuense]|uniref:SDR family oxidoreductase n=1 Tax=Alloacidobacterium dinghuense TaxID=2763107 RepID=A0A7G8BMY8_9BACT|nr:SDR family oxidoreductase [Alloacidobacterium dinghuense]QNI33908.1 SDR family oxidoreductase [Alloacidobacterium dinghuense]
MEIKGQLAIVTGAGRGIGEAVGKRLAAMGATVLLAARDLTQLQRVQHEIQAAGGSAEAAQLDLQDEQSIANLAAAIENRHGRCDILVNNAAVGSSGKPLFEMSPAEWDQLMATNLRGPYLMIRALAPMMIAAKSGHIVNISSLAGHNPLPNGAAYSASKWGLNGLSYSVAEELRPHGIRVSVIAPGSVNTRFEGRGDRKDPNKKIQPDDVAHVVAMLVTQAPQSFVSEVLLRPTQKP